MKHGLLLLSWIVISTSLCAWAQGPAPDPGPGDATLDKIKRYEFGQSRAALIQVEELVRQALNQPAQPVALEKRLLELLQSDATIECKRFACRQLYLIGSAEAVPVLAGLLDDPALADMARYALQRIPLPSVDAALRQALSKTQGPQKVGVIYALSQRQDSQATEGLIDCLSDADDAVVRAAITALEKVGGQTSIRALQQALSAATPARRGLLVDALLTWADHLLARGEKAEAETLFRQFYQPAETQAVRMAALRGLVAVDSNKNFSLLLTILSSEADPLQAIAADHLRYVAGNELTRRTVAALPRLPAAAQALVLAALGDRQDAAALPTVAAAVRSAEEAVCVAALRALGSLGGADQVPLLADYVACDHAEKRATAQESLNHLRGNDVDVRILQCLKQRDTKTQNELIRCLGARVAVAAMPALLEVAQAADPALRESTGKALGVLAGINDLPALVKLMTHAKDEANLAAAENATATACSRQEDQEKCVRILLEHYAAAPIPAQCALLRMLGTIGHGQGLLTVRQALKDSNPQIQDTALRVLAEWPSAEPANDLLSLARGATAPTQRILAWRGFIAMAGLPGLSNADRLKMYKQALAETQRPEETKLVLGGLATVTSAEAFQIALQHLDNPAVRAEAAAAMVEIAGALKGRSANVVSSGLKTILASSVDSSLKTQAQKILNATSPRGPVNQ